MTSCYIIRCRSTTVLRIIYLSNAKLNNLTTHTGPTRYLSCRWVQCKLDAQGRGCFCFLDLLREISVLLISNDRSLIDKSSGWSSLGFKAWMFKCWIPVEWFNVVLVMIHLLSGICCQNAIAYGGSELMVSWCSVVTILRHEVTCNTYSALT